MTSSTTPNTAANHGGTTAETAIEIPDYVTMITPGQKRSIAALAEHAADLLAENGLPAPVYFSVSEGAQEVSLLFGDTPTVSAPWPSGPSGSEAPSPAARTTTTTGGSRCTAQSSSPTTA